MINEVDEAIRSLVRAEVINGADVEVVFDAPTREWASRRNRPTIDMYLYDIREDTRRRSAGMIERRNERGMVEERQGLPRFFKLAYLITAWTQRPEDEHRLLSAVLACFLQYDVMPASVLPPLLVDVGFPLGIQIAFPPSEDRQVSDVWSSLGGDLKPSVDLVITLAIQPQRLYEIAQAVMAPLRLRAVGQVTYEADDGVRHLPDTRAEPAQPAQAAEAAKAAQSAAAATKTVVGGRPRKSARGRDS
jgi:Pvc16 N-terminal domain